MNKLLGKTALITGCSGKIGNSIIKIFLDENIDNIIAIYNKTKLDNSILNNPKIQSLKCDLSNETEIIKLYEKHLKNKDISILVNCAGYCQDSPFLNISAESFKTCFQINFWSAYYLIKLLIPSMIENDYGKIINISSTSSFGTINKADYCASKSALDGLTRALAKEYASKNITINSIQPSLVDTKMLSILPQSTIDSLIEHTAIKRLGTPDEIGKITLFLASEDSSYVNGENIIASGGSITRDL